MSKLLYGEKLVKAFGEGEERRNVLDGVSVEIAEGEFVAVMGASGSGKSTLLYALSGMERVDEGEVVFAGKSLSALSDDDLSDLRRNKMGFVFQQPTLLRSLNLLDNILLPQMRDHRRDVKKLTAKAKLLMKRVGIGELSERNITQASGGQLQRAGVCRALMNSPEIIFADEPTGALNSKASDEMMALLGEIHRGGTAILLVTHDARVAARAQRVLFMQDGRLVSALSPGGWQAERLAEKAEQVLLEMRRLEI